jgi:predicted cobalt transporter CbtA
MGSDQHFQNQETKLTRWLFAVVCVLAVVLALVVHGGGGPWYGILALALIALAAVLGHPVLGSCPAESGPMD